ncbi:B-cell receptor CD22-like isoform X2 [Clupea harengus]|uniref:B-cell receptor CD22-like isoform X2 n=1 Tax=Clupea harengus TaxID=7950 RepID=A0A8M1KBA6_CLUHA|nr:B-cell receptor CD22-like isoform X2 [Clupea harengus]
MFSFTDPPQTSVSISPPGHIQEGTDVTLTCNSTSDLPVKSYSWSKSGHRDLGTEKKYTIKHFRPEDSGWYDCRSLYECGFRDSSTVHLQVSYRPKNTVVVIEPPGQITEGSRVTLTCSTDANPPAHDYRWFKKGRNTHLSNSETLSFSPVRYEERGEYSCQATNTYGSTASPSTSLRVLYPPKNTRIESDPSGEIIEGSTVTLTCMSEADPPVQTYTWIKKSGAVQLKSGKEKTLIFSKIRSEDRGEYLCQAANRIGQPDSSSMFIQVLCEYHCKSTPSKIH